MYIQSAFPMKSTKKRTNKISGRAREKREWSQEWEWSQA